MHNTSMQCTLLEWTCNWPIWGLNIFLSPQCGHTQSRKKVGFASPGNDVVHWNEIKEIFGDLLSGALFSFCPFNPYDDLCPQQVMVTNVTSLLKTVKAVEDEATKGTRALEATIEHIRQELAVSTDTLLFFVHLPSFPLIISHQAHWSFFFSLLAEYSFMTFTFCVCNRTWQINIGHTFLCTSLTLCMRETTCGPYCRDHKLFHKTNRGHWPFWFFANMRSLLHALVQTKLLCLLACILIAVCRNVRCFGATSQFHIHEIYSDWIHRHHPWLWIFNFIECAF